MENKLTIDSLRKVMKQLETKHAPKHRNILVNINDLLPVLRAARRAGLVIVREKLEDGKKLPSWTVKNSVGWRYYTLYVNQHGTTPQGEMWVIDDFSSQFQIKIDPPNDTGYRFIGRMRY